DATPAGVARADEGGGKPGDRVGGAPPGGRGAVAAAGLHRGARRAGVRARPAAGREGRLVFVAADGSEPVIQTADESSKLKSERGAPDRASWTLDPEDLPAFPPHPLGPGHRRQRLSLAGVEPRI